MTYLAAGCRSSNVTSAIVDSVVRHVYISIGITPSNKEFVINSYLFICMTAHQVKEILINLREGNGSPTFFLNLYTIYLIPFTCSMKKTLTIIISIYFILYYIYTVKCDSFVLKTFFCNCCSVSLISIMHLRQARAQDFQKGGG